jgi:alanyl-tRNA synthetase
MAGAQDVDGVQVLAARIDGVDVDALRELADRFRDKVEAGVVVLATVKNDKPVLITAVTKNLIPRGVKAGDIVREVAKMVGGGGGGRPDMAQAGGRDASKLPDALNAVPTLVKNALNGE